MGNYIGRGDYSSHSQGSQPNIDQRNQPRQTPPQRPPPIPTEKLVENLEKKFKEWIEIINNLKSEKRWNMETRAYIHSMMEDTEKELHSYNCTTVKETQNTAEQVTSKTLLDKVTSLQKDLENTNKEATRLLSTMGDLEDRLKKAKERNKTLENELRGSKDQCKQIQNEKRELVLRLSKLAGEKLVANNPAITDLSDPNRPTKLGEIYSELYDNEWSDAFEDLQAGGYGDEEALEILRLTLIDAVDFCKEKSSALLSKSEEVVQNLFADHFQTPKLEQNAINRGMTMGHQRVKGNVAEIQREKTDLEELQLFAKVYSRWRPKTKNPVENTEKGDELKTTKITKRMSIEEKYINLRKDTALSFVPMVQKAYIKSTWDKTCIKSLKPYIRKCIFVGWMMVVQTPPMALLKSDVNERSFKKEYNKDVYKPYTQTGSMIKYVVWPVMLLHDKGPLILKGVAQCYQ